MRSDIVKKGATRCAHRSLFHANRYGEEDLKNLLEELKLNENV